MKRIETGLRKASMVHVHLGHAFHKEKIAIVYAIMQIALIILFGVFANYHPDADSRKAPPENENDFIGRYSMFQDVHIMIFVGFGFLMTFLKRYGFSAIGFNFLIASIAIQWSLFINGVINSDASEYGQFYLQIKNLIGADFCSAAVLISFGALIGKTSPLQLLILTVIEVVLFEVNIFIGEHLFGASDAGGSMFIHCFGAYFGLAVSFVIRKPWHNRHKGNSSTYNSDLFAMIGSLFLWICWPTFNGALLSTYEAQHRTAINTYLSLAACVSAAFATSLLVSKQARLEMDLVQNATLAGGVAVGTTADFMIYPVGSMCIGGLVGVVSVLGFHYLTPFLATKFHIHDTCGVHNLHGLPGFLAGVMGIIAAGCATPEAYGKGLGSLFHHRQSFYNETAGEWMNSPSDDHHHWRTAGEQAGYQAAALAVTMGISLVGGLFTGYLLTLDFLIPVSETQAFHDEPYWYLPDDVANEEKEHKVSGVNLLELDQMHVHAKAKERTNATAAANQAHSDGTEVRERVPSNVKFETSSDDEGKKKEKV